LFRCLFHQSVAGPLSCSLSLTASSQLKPFVFCIAVCSLVGRRTVVFLLLSLQMPGTHSTGQLLSSAPSRKSLVVVVACLWTRSLSSSVSCGPSDSLRRVDPIDVLLVSIQSTLFFVDRVLLSFVNRHSLHPHWPSSFVGSSLQPDPSSATTILHTDRSIHQHEADLPSFRHHSFVDTRLIDRPSIFHRRTADPFFNFNRHKADPFDHRVSRA